MRHLSIGSRVSAPWLLAVSISSSLLGLLAAPAPAQDGGVEMAQRRMDRQMFNASLTWPEDQRAFLQDGPALLLPNDRVRQLMAQPTGERAAWIEQFLSRDPDPSTPENELMVGIENRRRAIFEEFISFQDVRAQLYFLHGPPLKRRIVDCAETFRPMELWYYREPGADVKGVKDVPEGVRILVLYRPSTETPFQLWLPLEGKKPLYIEEMAYYLEQWEEMKQFITAGRRIDRFFCDDSREIDRIVGIDQLYRYRKNRPENSDFLPYLRAPDDLAAWARKAAAETPPQVDPLDGLEMQIFFPERQGQRMLTRFELRFDDGDTLETFDDGELQEKRVVLDGFLERAGVKFDDFRVRYLLDAKRRDLTGPVALVADRKLRPTEKFLLRLKVIDEVSGKESRISRAFVVPTQEVGQPRTLDTEQIIQALGEELVEQRVEGYDSVLLVPPVQDVIFGLWRAEALVTGTRISEVRFVVDDEVQFKRRSPPWTAELRLETFPTEQTVRIEGYDKDGELLGSDEVVLNQPRGELRVTIQKPGRGGFARGEVEAEAQIVVPEERRVEKVEFSVNDVVQFTLDKPPWRGMITVPETTGADLAYLTVTAELNDGLKAEDVRFLNAPDFVEEVDVDLVELYTTVVDRGGRLVRGLEAKSFSVKEDGRPQEIVKFELVEDLPLSVGIAIDTSGSMYASLGVAQRTAIEFLNSMITPRDRAFAVAFADRPEMLMTRTSDVGAINERLNDLVADGNTSLHDAVVTSLYYYRGVSGRRMLVLLSDGEDTSSSLQFDEALEYARRSGVAIYTIGLNIGRTDVSVRGKLNKLAEETGGRTFFIKAAEELRSVYAEIEKELRSQYLLAYESDQGGSSQDSDRDTYREVEVQVDGGYKARTIKGYYP